MKQMKFWALAASVLTMGLVSCSDDENENNKEEEKQTFYCRWRFDVADPIDTLLLNDDVWVNEVFLEKKTLQEAFQEAAGVDDTHFKMEAADTTELQKMMKDLAKKVDGKIDTKNWNGYFRAQTFCSQDEKDSHMLCEKYFGKSSGSNSFEFHSDQEGPGYFRYSVMDYTFHVKWFFGRFIPIGNELPRSEVLVELATEDKIYIKDYWAVCDKDMNEGAGGEYVYICGKLRYEEETPVTHAIVLYSKVPRDMNFKLTYENRSYQMSTRFGESNGDLNQEAGGPYLYLMYTKDDNEGKTMNAICTSSFQPQHAKITEADLAIAWDEVRHPEYSFKIPLVDEKGNLMEEWANASKDCKKQGTADYVMLVGLYTH